jgi:hypothetical protein
MIERLDLSRRAALRLAVGGMAAAAVGGPARAAGKGPVPTVQLTTTTAAFDPVRPQSAMLISRATKQIGLDINPNPIEYNVGIQQVEAVSQFEFQTETPPRCCMIAARRQSRSLRAQSFLDERGRTAILLVVVVASLMDRRVMDRLTSVGTA